MRKSKQMFRPYLTPDEIALIISQCQSMTQPTKVSIGLIQKLSVFEFKIQSHIVSASYTAEAKKSLSESLGFSDSDISVLSDSEKYCFLCELSNPTEEQISEGRELELKLFGNLVGGI
jgi:hypothetical protein